jgi:hypothetical protein
VKQADRAHLDEIVVRLTPASEALGEVMHERQVSLDDRPSQGAVTRVRRRHGRQRHEAVIDAWIRRPLTIDGFVARSTRID